jgi:hypothetical protein
MPSGFVPVEEKLGLWHGWGKNISVATVSEYLPRDPLKVEIN